MSYVLIVFVYSSLTIDIRSIDFDSKEKCEAAKEAIYKHIPKSHERGKENAVCLPK